MSILYRDENVLPFRQPELNQWIVTYIQAELANKSEKTRDAYGRILRQVSAFVADLPGSNGQFHPRHLTKTAIGAYIDQLQEEAYSTTHQERVKVVINGFAQWLIAEGELRTNPTHGLTIPAQALLAPRELSKEQRIVLKNLIERATDEGDLRGAALFALGYWAGCRVSDVSHLLMRNAEVGPKIGKLKVGYKQGKYRDILLLNQARGPLYTYLQYEKRERESAYVFTSQRETMPAPEEDLDGWRLSEKGIHQWLRALKRTATAEEWPYIQDVTFHDLRHDFAHRAKQAGVDDGELAVYLGHITKRGTPAIQTTARYTQPSMDQVKEKLSKMKG